MAQLVYVYETTTGQVTAQTLPSAAVASGAIISGLLGNNAVVSGSIASGQIAWPHVAAGGILSASVASGSLGPHIAAGGILSAHVASGSIGSAHLAVSILGLQSGDVITTFIASGGLYSGGIASGQLNSIMFGNAVVLSQAVGANVLAATHVANQGLTSSVYASGSLGGFHFAAAGILSAAIASGLAHHIEAFVTSTDTGGVWSAAWKASFGTAPAAAATAKVPTGVASGTIQWASIINVTTALVNGGTYQPGALAGAAIAAASGAVYVLAHDPTA